MTIEAKIKRIIDEEISKAGLHLNWNINELLILKDGDYILEKSTSNENLSKALIDHFFPRKLTSAVLAHYTSLEKFASILSTRTIRLNCLLDKLGEAEFKSFSEDYGFAGHVDENGRPYDEVLMEQTFFTSFTNLMPNNENLLWNVFGKQGAGVKIQFEITVNQERSELRPIVYSSETDITKSLLKTIVNRLKEECNKDFIPRGISRIGAFYLPVDRGLESEEETRLVVKTWGEGPGHDLIVVNGNSRYFPIEIDKPDNDFCHVKLISVEAGRICSIENVSKLLHKHGFGHVAVSQSQ